jgi:hypothetical protein
MGAYTGLLFLQGHIADTALALSLAAEVPAGAPASSREPGSSPSRPSEPSRVCRRGAILSVCGATALSPFR